ncbi:MAG: hypothetical protein Kow0089_10010 [Desulfobulbaceae bacterium]
MSGSQTVARGVAVGETWDREDQVSEIRSLVRLFLFPGHMERAWRENCIAVGAGEECGEGKDGGD